MRATEATTNLARAAERHAAGVETPTPVPRMTIWRHARPTGPTPALFEPKVYLLLQGTKRLTVGERTLEYRAGDYSVSSLSLPFIGQVTQASEAAPYLGLELRLEPAAISELLLSLTEADDDGAPAIAVSPAPAEVMAPLGRLMALLDAPDDIPVMAPLLERELIYRLLRGPMAGTLRQMVQSRTRFAQVRKAVAWICAHAEEALRVERLAASVGMSVTSFHRHFRAVTGYSPLAYQRRIRLLAARHQLASDGVRVTAVALAAGYASPSQFSREYKRMFGVAPAYDARTSQP